MPDVDARLARIAGYQDAYLADYGFEAVMVAARRRQVGAVIDRYRPAVVVEVGCGVSPAGAKPEIAALPFTRWVAVEPAAAFAAAARARAAGEPRLRVVEAFAEDAVDEVRCAAGGPADLVVCSSLLHELAEPGPVAAACAALAGPTGLVYFDVPNAWSLHRRLARAMGLIAREAQPSARNTALAQASVLDLESLARLAGAAGLDVVESGGYFLKPFTHDQMDAIGFIDGRILDGLFQPGAELPELAAEVFVVGRPR